MTNGFVQRAFAALIPPLCFCLPGSLADADEPAVAHGTLLTTGSEIGPPEGGVAFLEQMQNAFASIIERCDPAVAAIRVTRRPAADGAADLFPRAMVTTGTGILLSDDGLILTCQHVVRDAMAIDVVLADGRSFRAKPLGQDARADLAVLRIRARDLPVAVIGDGDAVRPGFLVLALGGKSGWMEQGETATGMGLVASVGRLLPYGVGADADRYYAEMIQFSTQVGPGNSGGPLVNIHGRVVGIVTASAPLGAGGFALPLNRANRRLIERLAAGERIEYGYFGADVAQNSADGQRAYASAPPPWSSEIGAGGAVATLADYRGGPLPSRDENRTAAGAAIVSIEPDGPADRAGLDVGDVVTAIDDRVVGSPQDFVQIAGGLEAGANVPVSYRRDGRPERTIVKVARRPAPVAAAALPSELSFRGASLVELSQAQRESFNLPRYAMLVTRVGAGTPADAAGLNPGDVVIRCEGADLSLATAEALGDANTRDVLFGLANGGSVLVKAP